MISYDLWEVGMLRADALSVGSPSHPSDPHPTGIASIGIHLPPLAMEVGELARLRGVDPGKYTHGLGCQEMALCPPGFGVVDLATEAARRALSRWDGDPDQIGLIAVGSESALDMSRPLSAWVADRLGIRGAVRSYEVKHACYGGTLALRQATEWRLSGAARGRVALVIACDVALYAESDPGEPTQGAGAVAMIVNGPEVAVIAPVSYPYSEPAFDFWRPVGESFPRVDGPFSLDCYKRAAERCFQALVAGGDPEAVLGRFAALCFHVPFPKMVRKAVIQVGESFGWDAERVEALYRDKVEPTMGWSRRTGNAYTASLWLSVAEALRGQAEGTEVAAFSYGSGFGAELLVLEAGPAAQAGAWAEDVERDIASRRLVDADEYRRLRACAA
jgi:hydroxymethylglutaryl-CoA synthase